MMLRQVQSPDAPPKPPTRECAYCGRSYRVQDWRGMWINRTGKCQGCGAPR